MVNQSKNGRMFTFLILLGAIAGSFIGDILGDNVKWLWFLKKSYSLGIEKPLILDLKVFSLTFGINFSINLMTIVGIILVIIIYKKK